MSSQPIGPLLCLIAVLGLSGVALADNDGAFCTAKGYLAYEVQPVSSNGSARHMLHIVRFEAERAISEVGEVALKSFQVHGMTCTPDRVDISGWGKGFEHYIIAVPAPITGNTNASVGAAHGLQIVEHHSDPEAKFDPRKDTPEPRWLWHEPLGSRLLDAPGDHQYFLVINGADKSVPGEITHHRTATVVEKSLNGTVLHTRLLYQRVSIETID